MKQNFLHFGTGLQSCLLFLSCVISTNLASSATEPNGKLLETAESSNAQNKPDVLFIAVDDLNDWTSYLGGHPQAVTPNIDRLVKRGVYFTNAHCAAPACNPSRAALMSGLRPWQTGIYLNSDPAAGVLKDVTTLNRHMLANGYKALGGGKIYHNRQAEGAADSWTEWNNPFGTTNGNKHNLNGLSKSHFDWGPLDNKPQDMGDYKLTDWAISKLKNPTEEPMFLAVGYVKPHLPWYVPQEYFDRFPLDEIQLPVVDENDLADIPAAGLKMAKPEGDHAAVVKAGEWKKAVQAYLATGSFLDDQVGRLVDALDESPRGKDTIIVWWSDHGWHLGEKEHWRKFALWEDATRTSFAIVAPGITPTNAACNAPVDYTSVYPTICQLTGVETPNHVTGPSLLPLLKDPKAEWENLAICTHGSDNHAVMDERFRYIRYEDGSEELYDHKSDPREWTNLASSKEHQDVINRLKAILPVEEAEPTSSNSKQPRNRNKKGQKQTVKQ